jgi:hypothetical protein
MIICCRAGLEERGVTTIRRIYAYLLAFAGLAMLSIAAASLLQVLVDVALQSPLTAAQQYVRDTVALNGAAALVGLPVWLVHWLWIQRTARADPGERVSTLRRLYLYTVLAGAAVAMAVSASSSLQALFGALVGGVSQGSLADAFARPLTFTLVALGVWLGHWRVAAADRGQVGESGGSATLRRWYIYAAAFIGLVLLLSGAQGLLAMLWSAMTVRGANEMADLPGTGSTILVGLAVWLVHWIVLPRELPEQVRRDDGVARLRSVYLFLALAVGVVGTLFGASQLLYYALGRFLGVDRPGGVGGDLVAAMAGPVSIGVVYGATWAYQRQALRKQAAAFDEAPRQAGIRRLYIHLVALVALAALGTGIGGLLWALGDVVIGGHLDSDRVALFATLAIVGLPVWIVHWRPRPVSAVEAHSLARRLYVYFSLIAATLALVGSAAAVLYQLLGLALGSPASALLQTDLAHALAVAITGATVATYHWRVLRAEARRAPQPSEPAVEARVQAVVEIEAPDQESLSRALTALRSTGVQVTVR